VLGELTGADPAWPGGGLIDPSRIGMAGHSAGGAAANAAMLADPRIRAGIDMAGSTAAPIPGEGLARPFLFWASNPTTPRETQAPWHPGPGTGNSAEAPWSPGSGTGNC
jgi:poly(3-hydroxybutyrate) depolymerase